MLKVLIVYGIRPEAIKMMPVVRVLRQRPDRFDAAVCATAQHREMMDEVHRVVDFEPV